MGQQLFTDCMKPHFYISPTSSKFAMRFFLKRKEWTTEYHCFCWHFKTQGRWEECFLLKDVLATQNTIKNQEGRFLLLGRLIDPAKVSCMFVCQVYNPPFVEELKMACKLLHPPNILHSNPGMEVDQNLVGLSNVSQDLLYHYTTLALAVP